MKYFLLFCISLVAYQSKAQDSLIRLSRFEEFSNQPGQIFRTESKEINSIHSVSVAKVKSTNIATGETKFAISLKPVANNAEETINSKIVYFELEELDSIIHVLDYFLKEAVNSKPTSQLYYGFTTEDDVHISCYRPFFESANWRISIRRIYKHDRTKVFGSNYLFNKKRLEELIETFVTAKNYRM